MSGFTRTLGYGAFASAVLPLAVLALSPVIGAAAALGLYGVFAVAGYLAVLVTGGARRRVGLACGSLAVGLAAWAVSESVSQLLVLLTVAVGLARSGLVLRHQSSLRGAVIEVVVFVGALLAARFLATPGLVGSAIALWGWFVVQSFAFLLGSIGRRRPRVGGDQISSSAAWCATKRRRRVASASSSPVNRTPMPTGTDRKLRLPGTLVWATEASVRRGPSGSSISMATVTPDIVGRGVSK